MALPTYGEAPVVAASKWRRRTGKAKDVVPGTPSRRSSEPAQAQHSTGTSPLHSLTTARDFRAYVEAREAAMSPLERMRDEYRARDPFCEHLDGAEALRLARQAAKADPPSADGEPWCQECPTCGEPHRKLVDLARCCRGKWFDEPSAAATFLWWCIRDDTPEAVHGISPDALGRRLVREGWTPRWVGNVKEYFYEDLPAEAAKPKPRKARRR